MKKYNMRSVHLRGKRDCFTYKVFCSFLAVSFLSGCSMMNRPVSEETVLSDIKKEDAAFANHELDVTDFTVTSRQTLEDLGTDTIHSSVVATGSEIEYHADYTSTYLLEKNGWEFSGLRIDNNSYNVLSQPSKEFFIDAVSKVDGDAEKLDCYEINTNNIRNDDYTGRVMVYDTSYQFHDVNRDYYVEAEYSLDDGWVVSKCERASQTVLLNAKDLEGKWYVHLKRDNWALSYEYDVYLTISNVTDSSVTIFAEVFEGGESIFQKTEDYVLESQCDNHSGSYNLCKSESLNPVLKIENNLVTDHYYLRIVSDKGQSQQESGFFLDDEKLMRVN